MPGKKDHVRCGQREAWLAEQVSEVQTPEAAMLAFSVQSALLPRSCAFFSAKNKLWRLLALPGPRWEFFSLRTTRCRLLQWSWVEVEGSMCGGVGVGVGGNSRGRWYSPFMTKICGPKWGGWKEQRGGAAVGLLKIQRGKETRQYSMSAPSPPECVHSHNLNQLP